MYTNVFFSVQSRTKGRAWRPFKKRENAENYLNNRRAKIMLKGM